MNVKNEFFIQFFIYRVLCPKRLLIETDVVKNKVAHLYGWLVSAMYSNIVYQPEHHPQKPEHTLWTDINYCIRVHTLP